MNERIKWIKYKNKRILYSDCTALKGDGILEMINPPAHFSALLNPKHHKIELTVQELRGKRAQ
ncbi:MAG: hypothetical protein ACFFDI_09015 [Promethearchaeota archaeon]